MAELTEQAARQTLNLTQDGVPTKENINQQWRQLLDQNKNNTPRTTEKN